MLEGWSPLLSPDNPNPTTARERAIEVIGYALEEADWYSSDKVADAERLAVVVIDAVIAHGLLAIVSSPPEPTNDEPWKSHIWPCPFFYSGHWHADGTPDSRAHCTCGVL